MLFYINLKGSRHCKNKNENEKRSLNIIYNCLVIHQSFFKNMYPVLICQIDMSCRKFDFTLRINGK